MRDSRLKIVLSFLFFIGMLLCFSGCSTPKHTNVLIFGTNTKFALDVSYEPTTSSPSITVGYKRQEAVWMPLLANIDNEGTPAKCGQGTNAGTNSDAEEETTAGSGQGTTGANPSASYDCLYKGSRDEDTYSVLASFGAKFSGEGATGGAKAGGGLAQYFATGLAAQILAKEGGARLVSVQSAETDAIEKAAIKQVAQWDQNTDRIIKYVQKDGTTDGEKLNDLVEGTGLEEKYNDFAGKDIGKLKEALTSVAYRRDVDTLVQKIK